METRKSVGRTSYIQTFGVYQSGHLTSQPALPRAKTQPTQALKWSVARLRDNVPRISNSVDSVYGGASVAECPHY